MHKFTKYIVGSAYAYGFLRTFYYNEKLKEYNGYTYTNILAGTKVTNIFYSTLFAIPCAGIYFIDDLNVIDSRLKKMDYNKVIFPLTGKYEHSIKE